MIKIVKLEFAGQYKIKLHFSDGENKIIDFESYIGSDELTSPLRDPAFFRQVKIYENGRGIIWPNEYDFCPDFLRFHVNTPNEVNTLQ